jgi:hypothetical protein
MVVDSQTLMSSCVLNRERSWLDFRTAKMGNKSSWQTVSQNSTGNDDPCFLRVLKSESSALQIAAGCKQGVKSKVHQRIYSQPSHFEVLSVHYNVIETKQDWEPVLDHRIVDPDILRA